MTLPYITVEGFEVELQLAKVFGLELVYLQLDGDEAVQPTMKEQEVERKIPSPDLHRVFGADKAEIAAQFRDHAPEIAQQTGVEIGLRVVRRQTEKLEDVGVFEEVRSLGVHFSQRC